MRRIWWQLPRSFKEFAEGVHVGHAIRHGVPRPSGRRPVTSPATGRPESPAAVDRAGSAAPMVDA
ncbi:hypothetical protein RM844_02380 [Streptomyces sp. DSM 44915]|uniref:Uncharacterized protein n=1 Tax=Streptomyces chisholmiae TaxID=3075540 RepID=A0ABU2JK56_9ACTN|nr:hypothetical protein [Streptomyces sp. DSM 44915]MDT0265131.1 hypothetical protein [Streptomyces sp. DSM 44915]